MSLEQRRLTNTQRVFDALEANGKLSIPELAAQLEMETWKVRNALYDLGRKRTVTCNRSPTYQLLPGSTRPVDMRGRKP